MIAPLPGATVTKPGSATRPLPGVGAELVDEQGQQVTKGGVFVGSNKLKHNTTGMLEIRFDSDGMASYLMFTKNRRGEVNRKMYFSLKESGDVSYDDRRFSIDEDAREIFEAEKSQIEDDDNAFDTLFGLINKE